MKQIAFTWLLCILSICAYAQQITVTGTVTDAENNPLIGAAVVVVGTTDGVITDFDGKYTIKAASGQSLNFSYVGYQEQTVKVDGRSVINVKLSEGELLDEVVINRKTSEDTDSLLKSKLKFDEIGIAEMLLMRNSDLINMPVKSSGLRAKYGVNILAIQRDNHYIFHNLKDVKLQYGDTLLIQGTWADIARLSEKTFEWVVVGQPLAEASKVTLTHKAPLAAGIMLLMIAAMVFNWVPAVAAVLIAAVLMVLCGCLRNVEEAYRTINWESIVLIAAMLPMSVALEKTGTSEAISHGLVAGLGGFGPFALMAGVYFTASLLTMFISNTATAVLLAPIALQSAVSMGISPYPLLLAVSVGTSMCFASPFSTPPNALVMPAGKYTFMDYVKVGVPLQVIMGLVMVVVIPLFFPFVKA